MSMKELVSEESGDVCVYIEMHSPNKPENVPLKKESNLQSHQFLGFQLQVLVHFEL